MQMPANWRNERSSVENGKTVGHDEYSGTIAVHSLAVLPEHQGKQVGTTLMKSYIQRIKEASIAERIVLIAHDNMVPYYEGFGFVNRGPSQCQYGGGSWFDMVRFCLIYLFPSSRMSSSKYADRHRHWSSTSERLISRYRLVIWLLSVAFLLLFPFTRNIYLYSIFPRYYLLISQFVPGLVYRAFYLKRPKATEF